MAWARVGATSFALYARALDAVYEVFDNPKTPRMLRFKAAMAILAEGERIEAERGRESARNEPLKGPVPLRAGPSISAGRSSSSSTSTRPSSSSSSRPAPTGMHYASDGVLTCDYCTGPNGLHLSECARPAELDQGANTSSASSPGTIDDLFNAEPRERAGRRRVTPRSGGGCLAERLGLVRIRFSFDRRTGFGTPGFARL
jgi:hypothetical protein